MTPEQTGQSQKEELPPDLSGRQIKVLQGLLHGFDTADFHRIGIEPLILTYEKQGIAEKFGTSSIQTGVCRGVVWGIKQDKFNTSSIPEYIRQNLEDKQDQFLEAVVQGDSIKELMSGLSLKKGEFRSFELEICRRIGVSNLYMAVACKAKDMKDRGEF